MRDYMLEIEECVDMLSVIYNVPPITKVEISGRMTRTFGECWTRKCEPDYTKLKFAKFLFEDDYPRELEMNTILHELIHAIDRNKHGHGKEWQTIADRVTMFYPYVGKIQQYTSSADREAQETVKPKKEYKVKCLECGKVTVRKGYRAPKWYTQTEHYHCSCGGRLKKII